MSRIDLVNVAAASERFFDFSLKITALYRTKIHYFLFGSGT